MLWKLLRAAAYDPLCILSIAYARYLLCDNSWTNSTLQFPLGNLKALEHPLLPWLLLG